MTKRETNIPAFPQPMAGDKQGGMHTSAEKHPDNAGLSIRDWFAGQVLASVASDERFDDNSEILADMCYRHADALMAEREKREGGTR